MVRSWEPPDALEWDSVLIRPLPGVDSNPNPFEQIGSTGRNGESLIRHHGSTMGDLVDAEAV
jgi:hypothetical protein